MQTPAVYDLQTEKLAFPETDRVSIGTEADVETPISSPRGNRGGVENIRRLLAGVAGEHVVVEFDESGAVLYPADRTATIYVDETEVGESGHRLRSGETVVLGREKSGLWDGYRVQIFF